MLSASDIGAPHFRKRIWIVAKRNKFFSYPMHDRNRWGKQQQKSIKEKKESISNTSSIGLQGQGQLKQPVNSTQSRTWKTTELKYGSSSDFWAVEPNVGRVANGMADRVDRLKAIGNGQVPLCAATAWRLLNERL
jgi:DNA (cytosine-5)-methyltransferase 1